MRITGGIPVGGNLGLGAIAGGLSFPIGPGKSDVDEEEQFKEMFKVPGSWRQQIKDYQRENPLQRPMPSAGIGNVGGVLLAQAAPGMQLANSQFYMGPQFGQVPAGFHDKIVS
jgi:hypothetical protein